MYSVRKPARCSESTLVRLNGFRAEIVGMFLRSNKPDMTLFASLVPRPQATSFKISAHNGGGRGWQRREPARRLVDLLRSLEAASCSLPPPPAPTTASAHRWRQSWPCHLDVPNRHPGRAFKQHFARTGTVPMPHRCRRPARLWRCRGLCAQIRINNYAQAKA